MENYDLSREYYLTAYKINRENGDEISLKGDIINNIGYSYFKEEDLPKAEEYYLQAVSLNPENNEMDYFKVVYNNLGELKLSTSDIKTAEQYFIKSEQVNNSLVLEIERHRSFKNLYQIYQTTNRFSEYSPYIQKLLDQSKELIILKKLLDKMLLQYQIKLVEYQRQLSKERFERKIERERQMWINIVVLLSLIILVIVIFIITKRFFFYRSKSRKIKDKYNHFRIIYNNFLTEYRAAIVSQLQLHRKLDTLPNTAIKGPWGENLWKKFNDDDDKD